jgi:peptide/nickel transport system ATP-binding protein
MAAIPPVTTRTPRLAQIPGAMPRLTAIPAGCAFHPRCGQVFDRCRRERPEPMPVAPAVDAACWLYAETKGKPAGAEA